MQNTVKLENVGSKNVPILYLEDFQGNLMGNSSVIDISELLKKGKILALKGIGGFHLICDALNKDTVSRLRKGKKRDAKPFALMAQNLKMVRELCYLSRVEESYLISPARPIVLLKQRESTKISLSQDINPGLDTLGIMLPYAPFHYLLFSNDIKVVVATSANLSSNPLITTTEDARIKLKDIADYLVLHEGQIENPCDDSVGHVINDKWQPIRRARGYVPSPISLNLEITKPLLACGGNLKNTFALAKGREVYLSRHLGDMDNYLNFNIYKDTIKKMSAWLQIEPETIVHDLHPDYSTTRFAQNLSEEKQIPKIAVQHHHAHMASCMAENNLNEKVIAVICDGTGYGTDGTIWGFEFFTGDYTDFERVGHLAQVLLPGGDISIKKPERMAYSFLVASLGEKGKEFASKWLKNLDLNEQKVLEIQLEKKINSVATSSCGRLFDAVSALLGVCSEQIYEGQAPMELESFARKAGDLGEFYNIIIEKKEAGRFQLNTALLWEEIIFDLQNSKKVEVMAYKFHVGVAAAIINGISHISKNTGLKKVVLSGGVFQNRLLTELVLKSLQNNNALKVYCHGQVPANDGGIALGQAVIGSEVFKNVHSSAF